MLLLETRYRIIKTVLSLSVKYNNIIIKRTMLTARAVASNLYAKTLTHRPILSPIRARTYEYKEMGVMPGKFQKSVLPNREGQNIPLHIASHVFGVDEETGKVVVILTSAKGVNMPQEVHIEKVAAEKFNGTFTVWKDAKTKQPLLDKNGNLQADPNKGGQYAAVLPDRRELSAEAKSYLMSAEELEKDYPGITVYFKTHGAKIDSIIASGQKKSGANTKFSKKLGGKDDEPI